MSAGAVAKRRQEKLQAAIREIGKRKENKICFDCKKIGIQPSVCLTFGIFVCTVCGGMHRGYSHKVKDISMTAFTDAEFETLQNGGNKKAKKLWLATYKKASFPIDDDTPTSRIKVFIRKCFEQKEWCAPPGSTTKKSEKRRRTRRKEKPKMVAPESNDSSRQSDESQDYYSHEEEEQKNRRSRAASDGDSILDILDLNRITMFPSQGAPTTGPGAQPSMLDNDLLVAPTKRVQAPSSQPVPGTQPQQTKRMDSRDVYSTPHPNQVHEGEMDVFSDLPRRVGGDTTDYQHRAVGMILNQLRNLQTEYGFSPSDLKGICKQALMTHQNEVEQAEAQKAAAARQQYETSHPSIPHSTGHLNSSPAPVPVDDGRNPFADEDEHDDNPFGGHADAEPVTGGNPFADDDEPDPPQQYPQSSHYHSQPPNWQHTSPQYPPQGYNNPNPYPPQGYANQAAYTNQYTQGTNFQQQQKDPFSSLSSLK